MFIYKFEKGTIRTGIENDLGTDDYKSFDDKFGKFIGHYNDNEHSKEELEVVYAFMKVVEEDDFEDESDYELVLTKDKYKILEMEMSDKYTLADMDFVLAMSKGDTPINFYCMDGYVSLINEEYIEADGTKNKRCHYLDVSWILD